MGSWSRVRAAKCQMLATSCFVLVTGRWGGWGAAAVALAPRHSVYPPRAPCAVPALPPWTRTCPSVLGAADSPRSARRAARPASHQAAQGLEEAGERGSRGSCPPTLEG